MKSILVLPILYIYIMACTNVCGCCEYCGPPDCCDDDPNIPSINHVWNLYEGLEIQENGYYRSYPLDLVITSVDTINYEPGDPGWFDALTYEFGSIGDTIFVDSCGDSQAPTYHILASYLGRIYTFGDSLDIRNDNFEILNIDVVEDLQLDPLIQVTTEEGVSFPIVLSDLTSTNLTLTSFFQDTFTHYWDPLNDTIYWSSFYEERRFTR